MAVLALDADAGEDAVQPARAATRCGWPMSSITAGSRTQTMLPAMRIADGQPDAELLDGRVAVEDEAGEHRRHDQRRRGDHATGGVDPVVDGLPLFALPASYSSRMRVTRKTS